MTLAALEATLRLYRDPSAAVREVPALRMLTTPVAELRGRCERLAERLRGVPGLRSVTVRDDTAFAGGGSLPDRAISTAVVALAADGVGDAVFAARLRTGEPAVVGGVLGGAVLLDLRTVFERQEAELIEAVRKAVSEMGPGYP
jgi:L-seryl-tRNA(Ser) seleniumtransferase